mgnify:CR=1 FL=1
MPLPLERESDVSVGGFQGIEKVYGLLVGIDVIDQPASWEGEGKVVKVSMEDTIILRMFNDEEPFELLDKKFSFLIPYKLTAGGKIVSGTLYDKCWRASAKELGKVPSDFIGQYVTLETQPRVLFPQPALDPATGKAQVDETGQRVFENVLAVDKAGRPKCFCFVADEDTNPNDVHEYIRGLIVGLNQKAALRPLVMDERAKQHPEYKEALNNGTLADMLELIIVDGKFQRVEKEVKQGSKENVET